jgi:hypothetical protein
VPFVAAAALVLFHRLSRFHRAIRRRPRHNGGSRQTRRYGDDEQATECIVEGSHGITIRCPTNDSDWIGTFRAKKTACEKSGNCGRDCTEWAVLAAALCVFAHREQASSAAE